MIITDCVEQENQDTSQQEQNERLRNMFSNDNILADSVQKLPTSSSLQQQQPSSSSLKTQNEKREERREKLRKQIYDISTLVPDADLDLIMAHVLATKGKDFESALSKVKQEVSKGKSDKQKKHLKLILELQQVFDTLTREEAQQCLEKVKWNLEDAFGVASDLLEEKAKQEEEEKQEECTFPYFQFAPKKPVTSQEQCQHCFSLLKCLQTNDKAVPLLGSLKIVEDKLSQGDYCTIFDFAKDVRLICQTVPLLSTIFEEEFLHIQLNGTEQVQKPNEEESSSSETTVIYVEDTVNYEEELLKQKKLADILKMIQEKEDEHLAKQFQTEEFDKLQNSKKSDSSSGKEKYNSIVNLFTQYGSMDK